MKHDRYREAFNVLINLRGHPILAAKELLYVHYQMLIEHGQSIRLHDNVHRTQEEGNLSERRDTSSVGPDASTRYFQRIVLRSRNYFQRVVQLFRDRRNRRALVTAVVCMVGQQLCGV